MIGIIDLIVIGIIVISVLFALYRGLVRELLGISSWLLAGFAALYSYDPFLKNFEGHFQNVKLAAITGSVLLALLILIVMTILNAAITRRLRKSSLSGLDRIFGLAFGVARALLVLTLIYIFTSSIVLSPKQIDGLKQNNISISYIQFISRYIENIFPDNIRNDLNSYRKTKEEKIVAHIQEKAKQKAVEAITNYNLDDRKSLDNMIENIVEIGDIE